MRFALLLLWLTAHAADWLTWRRVGEATLTWGPFTGLSLAAAHAQWPV